ncbi:hypothetical protein [Melissospora conviva]|uniref:hypothetical protein n=1 Tax=Melissospora conviva TaxID=3388432 RepID=UPI003B7F6499
MDAVTETMESPLVAEAIKKAAVAWVSIDDGPAYALWCLPVEGALYVVSGPGEQSAPGLAEAQTAAVTLRGDHGGRIVTWPAAVTRVEPDGEQWQEIAHQVAAKRLNARGSISDLAQRWARECVLTRLAPLGLPTAGESLPDGSLAAAPRPTPAARRTAKPFRLHRVRRR